MLRQACSNIECSNFVLGTIFGVEILADGVARVDGADYHERKVGQIS